MKSVAYCAHPTCVQKFWVMVKKHEKHKKMVLRASRRMKYSKKWKQKKALAKKAFDVNF